MTQFNQAFPQFTEIREPWRSVCMIPVARHLLLEKLNRLEANNGRHSKILDQLSQAEIQVYWEIYQHWNQADLNPKQREWMQEIHLYLNSLQQSLFKSPA
jgi:hypothetical protein